MGDNTKIAYMFLAHTPIIAKSLAYIQDSFPDAQKNQPLWGDADPSKGVVGPPLVAGGQCMSQSRTIARNAGIVMVLIFISRLLGFVDRKSTRLNSSHVASSYAVFC